LARTFEGIRITRRRTREVGAVYHLCTECAAPTLVICASRGSEIKIVRTTKLITHCYTFAPRSVGTSKTPRTWKQHTPYARVRATLTPLCGIATPILMVPEASGGLVVYMSNPRHYELGFVSPGFESHAPPTYRA
jgi:hypothetical protein